MQFLAKEALTPQCHATSSLNLDVSALYISSLPGVFINRKYDTNIIFTIITSHLSSLFSSHPRTDHPYSVIPTNSKVVQQCCMMLDETLSKFKIKRTFSNMVFKRGQDVASKNVG